MLSLVLALLLPVDGRTHLGADFGPMGVFPVVFWQGNVGGSLFVGRRLTRADYGELFFNFEWPTNSYRIGGGNPCAGTGSDELRGMRFGVRGLVQILPRDLHPRWLNWFFGASLGGGWIVDRKRSDVSPGSHCWWGGAEERSPMAAASLVTAWEVPATPWLSIRWSIELGGIVSIGAGLLFDTSLGPVIRF